MRLAKEKEAKRLAEEAAKAAKAAEAAAAKAAATDLQTPQSDAANAGDSTRARGPSLLAQMPKKPANANASGGGADAIVDNVFGSLHHADTSSIIDEIRRRRGQQVRPRERVR